MTNNYICKKSNQGKTADQIKLEKEAKRILQLKAEIRERRKRKAYSGSKLRRFFGEAKVLREVYGFTFEDISLWLREFKRVKLSPAGVKSAYHRIDDELNKGKENG